VVNSGATEKTLNGNESIGYFYFSFISKILEEHTKHSAEN
jgi:hypothetical protein